MDPGGRFLWAIHRPHFSVVNLRRHSALGVLGRDEKGNEVLNIANFPDGPLDYGESEEIVEIPNSFPFWGATYILTWPAGKLAEAPGDFSFEPAGRGVGSGSEESLREILGENDQGAKLSALPRYLLLAMAQNSRDPALLSRLAELSCELIHDANGAPVGLRYHSGGERPRPLIHDHDLYEALGNNPALPLELKGIMVLFPGAQGDSPVVGEYMDGETHVWEYLRANSYIPWGHFASNMAHDSVRYSAGQLSYRDMLGLRHLYYQRVYVKLAVDLKILDPQGASETDQAPLGPQELEELRSAVLERFSRGETGNFSATMWGWNYGFDFSPSGFRLHASHQQIHQQFALVREEVDSNLQGKSLPSFAVGDLVADFASEYKGRHGRDFFQAYISAIVNNRRTDGRMDLPSSLIVHEDDDVMVFIPKAQRSQGEVQVMTKKEVGNILEADVTTRLALDRALFMAIKALHRLGARMVTSYEVSKRFHGADRDQRLFYCMLPRHPQSPGAFSERQQRWVTGHYPEDFARAMRMMLPADPTLLTP